MPKQMIPTEINDFPVLAAFADLHREHVTVICDRSKMYASPHPFVVWTVYPADGVNTHTWHAERGDYCTTYEDAVSAFVDRAKLNPLEVCYS